MFIDGTNYKLAEYYVFESPDENGCLLEISYKIPDGSKALFFPAAYSEKLTKEHVFRFNFNQEFQIFKCGSCYLASTISKSAGLLILSLILL